jgi:transposase-like protein
MTWTEEKDIINRFGPLPNFNEGFEGDLHRARWMSSQLNVLLKFSTKNGAKKYPQITISWHRNWAGLSTFFKYLGEGRTLIYTNNTIEGFNRQLRKVTKNKGVFPTDDRPFKDAIFGHDGHHKKMNRTSPRLGADLFAAFDFLC